MSEKKMKISNGLEEYKKDMNHLDTKIWYSTRIIY